MFKIDVFDNPGTYEEKVKEIASALLKSIPHGDREEYDYTPVRRKKRTETIINYVSEAKKRLDGICENSTIEAYFAFSNLLIMKGGYNYAVDFCNETTLSAAIWILDQLSLQDKLDEIYSYLPDVSDDETTSDLAIHPISHPMYDEQLVDSLVYLIRHRNSSKPFKDYKVGALMWDAEKPDNDDESLKNRKAFNHIIGLIDKQAIDTAIKKYEDDIWRFYRLSFRAYDLIDKRGKQIIKEISDIEGNIDLIKPENLNVLSFPPQRTVDVFKKISFDSKDQTKVEYLRREYEWLDKITFTQLSLENDREKVVRKLKSIIPEELANELIHFHVEDPYESAFALLYMLDTGSDIPWLYYGSISVAYTMSDQFPFDAVTLDMDEPVLLSELNSALYEHKYSGYRWSNRTDASGEPVQRTLANNLSQLIYANSASLFPRITPRIPSLETFLDNLGELTERERDAYSLLLYSLHSGSQRARSLDSFRLEQEFKDDILEEVITEKDNSEKDVESLYNEIRRLREKNTRLISAVQESIEYRRTSSSQLENLIRITEKQKKELADLRERVFLSESGEEIEEPEDQPISYPYHTTGRILSFGGTASWVNEMKKKLPDVIFVSADILPNADLIRGADEVWIQVNCISHSNYYKIMDSLGSTEKQVRYFVYSGVTKCAEQIVKANESNK